MKKIISLVMSLSMILSSVGVNCFAESVNKENQEQTTSEVEKSANKTLENEVCGKEEGQKFDEKEKRKCFLKIMHGPVTDIVKFFREKDLKTREDACRAMEDLVESGETAFINTFEMVEAVLEMEEKSYNDRKKAYEDRKKAYEDRKKAYEDRKKAYEDRKNALTCREDNFKRIKEALEKIKNERKDSTTALTFIR